MLEPSTKVVQPVGPDDADTQRKYIVIVDGIFSSRDWDRFGLAHFESHGYRPIGIECLTLYRPIPKDEIETTNQRTDPRVEILTTPDELYDFLGKLTAHDLIVNLIPPDRFPELYHHMQDRNLAYATLEITTYPFRSCLSPKRRLKDLFASLALEVHNLAYRIYQTMKGFKAGRFRPVCLGGLPGPRWILTAGDAVRTMFDIYPYSPQTERVVTVANDVWLIHSSAERTAPNLASSPTDRPFAVFLDSALYGHPEFKMIGLPILVTEEAYFRSLNRLFDRIEETLGMPVVIAGHPRCDYDDEDKRFGGRRVIVGDTQNLVRHASLVINHQSTAVSFAIYHRRPILFITTDEIQNWTAQRINQDRLAGWFLRMPINIDAPQALDALSLPDVDEPLYARYERKFLGPRDKAMSHNIEPLRIAFERHLREAGNA